MNIIAIKMPEDFKCACGNTSHLDGFFPCDEQGNEVEPVAGEWVDLYVCAACNQVYRAISEDAE